MNDRINDLAIAKAGAILMDLIMPDTENPDRINWNINCTKEHLINFADIIIKECLDHCYNKGMNDSLYEGQLKAASYIEEHFGL